MEKEQNNNIEIKERVINKIRNSKLIIIIFLIILSTIFVTIYVFKSISEKENLQVSEKYIRAGLFLASEKREKSRALFEEIILSKNKTYSILALNAILEQNLESDERKILEYFRIVEKLKMPVNQKNLILFKKALYLIKKSNIEEGNKLLKDIIKSESELKFIAEEIISD